MTHTGVSGGVRQRAWKTRVGAVVLLMVVVVMWTAARAPATALPAAPSPSRPAAEAGPRSAPSVAFFGDSIGYNAQAELRAAIEPSYRFLYRAAGGSAIEYWRDPMVRLVRERRPDTLLIELGTADAGWDHSSRRFERDVRQLLDAVSPHVPCIRWFDIRSEPSLFEYVNKHAVDFNRILWRVAADYPNVEVMHYSHWATLAHDGNYWWPDFLHHNAAGRRELALMARQAAVGCDPARTSGPYWDVPDDSPIAAAVAWMAAGGISNGYPNRTYRAVVGSQRPLVTRAEAVTFLWRIAGSPTGFPASPWSDVPSGLARRVDWSTAAGVMAGFEDGTWRSSEPVTRAQLVTALWHLAGDPTAAAPSTWTDVPPEMAAAFDWADEAGLLSTFADGSVRPNASINRGKIATMLYAFHQRTTLPPEPTLTAPPSTTLPTATVPPSTSVPSPAVTTPVTTLPPTTSPPTTSPPTSSPPTSSPTTTVPPAR